MATIRHLACSGGYQLVSIDAYGSIHGLGSPQRCFTPAQRSAITARDGGCIIPGCTIPGAWREVHHVDPAENGGPTHTDNGASRKYTPLAKRRNYRSLCGQARGNTTVAVKMTSRVQQDQFILQGATMAGGNGSEWKRPGWYVIPKNAREVMSLIGSIGVYNTASRFAWRGMSSADHNLNSALQRSTGYFSSEADVRSAELEIIRRARDWGLGLGDTDYQDDLQLLADLQHFGVPTRLIDFTSNPMTALWFACLTSSASRVAKSGLLLALNVSRWPVYETIGQDLPTTWGSIGQGISTRAGRTLATALDAGSPFLVNVAHPNARLRAQEGFFAASAVPTTSTLVRTFSTPFFGLNVPIPERTETDKVRALLTGGRTQGAPANIPYVAIIVPAGFKRSLLKYLQSTYNRSAKVLFPDFEGFRVRGDYHHLLGTLETYEQHQQRVAAQPPSSLELAT